MSATLPGMEAGTRTEGAEHRVIVYPDGPPGRRWIFRVHGDPRAAAAKFAVPTRVETRTIVTYTTPWREVTDHAD